VDAAALSAAKALQGQAGFEDEATRAACDSMEMNGAPVVMNGTACVSTNSNATYPVTFFDTPVQGGPPIRHVRVEGHEPMPTTFLRFLDWMVPGDFSKIDVAAAAEAGPERPVDLMLILDRSGSMSISVGGQTKLAMLKTAVNAFLDQKFTGNDRIGLISFGYRGCGNSSGTDNFAATCSPDEPLGDATSSFINTLKTKVNALQAPGATLTNTMEALRTARPAMAAVFNDPNRALSRKAVLLVTDGKPTVMRIDDNTKCHQDPFNNNLVSNWSGGTFNSGCLQGATDPNGDSAFRMTLSAVNNPNNPVNSSALFQHVESCTRSLSSCAGTNGAMYEANVLRNCGTGNSSCSAGGAHDVLVFAIGIGAINNSQPNASFDKHAKCLLSRIANANDILNTGTNTLETMRSVCTNPQTPPAYSDGDTYADLRDGCGSAPCVIDSTQEKGKVYIVDTNGNVPAQLQQVFNEIAALLKLRLTL
jgi:hypothetical protein